MRNKATVYSNRVSVFAGARAAFAAVNAKPKLVVAIIIDQFRYDYLTRGEQASKGGSCTDADPASSRRLLVSTLGDELRAAHNDSKVIGISIKARGAILPSGHRAAGPIGSTTAT